MKTLKEFKKDFEDGTLDGRFTIRLAQFIPQEELSDWGLKLDEGCTHEHKEFTRENVLSQLKEDVAFGFDKALGQRGLSAGMMYECVSQWNKILEEGLEDFEDYAQYGLPLFKATAVKYGFNNEIGDDYGDEDCYSSYDPEDY